MSKSIVKNYTDTPISGVTELNLARGLVNYAADFRVKSETAEEAVITNMTSPISFPEKFRTKVNDLVNIYKGSGVDPALYPPSKKGVSILSQISEVWTVVDSTDTTFQVALPVSAHIIVKVPNSEYITAADVQTLVGRLISGLYETGSESTERLSALLRGSMLPKDL